MKNKFKLIAQAFILSLIIFGCTKIEDGFLSPFVQYASDFTLIRGRTATSYSLTTDGSSIPLKVKLLHVYNDKGEVVDDIFNKTYPVDVWTARYDASTDKDYASIKAKQKTVQLPPIVVNESNGMLESNAGTLYLPIGTYSMDMEISNEAGTEVREKIIKINIVDGPPIEITPESGAFSASLLVAGTASGAGTLFNGNNNPFVDYKVTRYADTPNVFVMKIMDRNGVIFNPKAGQIAKRPNSGINPNPPFLQNLQDYAPDTFQALDTAMTLKFPLVPFPLQSLGNGYNMYYRIPAQAVQIDNTSTWSSNTAGNFYKGTADPHYLGVHPNGAYDYAIRVPMRIYVPGAYKLEIKLLNTTHR